MEILSCDFETTTKAEDCRVWAAGAYNIHTEEWACGQSIEWLFDYFESLGTCKAYFHNLKFDGTFILDWLFRHGYEHSTERKLLPGEFNTLISDKNQFYSIKIKTHNGTKITLLDSLKIIPFSVKVIANAFGLPMTKGEIDYHKERPIGYVIDEQEEDYIRRDCAIVARSLQTLFSQNLDRITQGSNALYDFKRSLPMKFEKIFPQIDCDEEIRKAYKGGYCYANPIHQGKNLGEGLVYDKNSMYPSQMKYKAMPYGAPKHYEGKYKPDKLYPLYIQKIACVFELKKEHLPTIQIKTGYGGFLPTEYVNGTNGEEIILTLTSIDLQLFLDQHEIIYIDYIEGWKFKGTTGLFDNYIDKWYGVKEESTRTGNHGMRTLAKLMLNALYGKFATSTSVRSKIPYYDDENKIVKYTLGEEESRDAVYLPVACFITAYARDDLIRNAQANYFRFAYSDTDSLHFIGRTAPKGLDIDSYRLGAWSLENVFRRARFLRAKCYIEEIPAALPNISVPKSMGRKFRYAIPPIAHYRTKVKLVVTCAGMPYACHKGVTWENFAYGSHFEGKMRFKTVSGGAVLIDTPYELKSA